MRRRQGLPRHCSVAFFLFCVVFAGTSGGCGGSSTSRWMVGWNVRVDQAMVSKNGNAAYVIVEKYIDPTGGRWDRRWRSEPVLCQVDLTSGAISISRFPSSKMLLGLGGPIISDSVFVKLRADPRLGWRFYNEDMHFHSYGDGKYSVYSYRPQHDSERMTILVDHRDSYQIVGLGFARGWVSSDEEYVVLEKIQSNDTWIYTISTGTLDTPRSGETCPTYRIGTLDLPLDRRAILERALDSKFAERGYAFYPQNEENLSI